MALRITGSSATRAATALGLLRAGDVAGYRALFAQAAAIEDAGARYDARCKLVQAALDASMSAPRARLAAIQIAAARETIAVLEQEAREPVLLSQAGVLMSMVGSLRAAQALFEAARRLDPELPKVAANLAEVARLRAARVAAPAGVLGDLPTRATRVAKRAQPAEGMTLTLCMIVKDEEEMLPRCLAAAAPAVDEMVIVDTGSSDRTVEIAKSFGARVIERPWTGSFADARNASLDAATSDWVFVLDADEVLVADDVAQVRRLLGQTWREAFYITEINYTGDLDDGAATTHSALRIFRSRPAYRYVGRLHEQILDTLPTRTPERFASVPARIEHFGYLGAVRDAKEKSRRNIELLLRQRDEGDDSAFMHFNLGSEYAAVDDAEAALAEFERATELLVAEPDAPAAGYIPALTVRYVHVLRACGRHEEAIAHAEQGLERFPGFTDLVFSQGSTANALGRTDDAIAYFERCIEMGDAPNAYTATVGMGTYMPTIELAQLRLRQGAAADAAAMLEACIAEHPGFFGLVHPLATALLAAGSRPEAVADRVEACVERLTPTMRFMLGTALYERGETVAAEGQYRELLEQQPTSANARVALAEALLSQSRWEEAAAVAAQLADDEAHVAAARRSELFARLVGGDLEGATVLLAREERAAVRDAERSDAEDAASAILSQSDRALFTAWLRALRGEDDATVMPLESVALLAVTLEALLRVQEVDAFGTLVPLLDRCPIPPREQRELRAGMYLRRGFLASAAEEWLAVCASDPTDVRALVGLAQCAGEQGMTEDAIDFAREAHALDPENERATRLLERLEPLAA